MPPDLKEYLIKHCIECRSGVFYLSHEDRFKAQEEIYLKVRKKEGRIYSDAVLRPLPKIDSGHPLYDEWKIRETSMKRFMVYLRNKETPVHLLDLGCGNGWIARHLADLPACEVFALDLNRPELEQGARVFAGRKGLSFIYGNLFEDIFPADCFDIIVLAGSIQYFSDHRSLLNRLFAFLRSGGEIHIIDSPFYNERTVSAAKERTKRHYLDLGFPDMTAHYHHPLFSSLKNHRPAMLYNPKAPVQRVRRKFLNRSLSPFPWIRLTKG